MPRVADFTPAPVQVVVTNGADPEQDTKCSQPSGQGADAQPDKSKSGSRYFMFTLSFVVVDGGLETVEGFNGAFQRLTL